MSGGPSPLARAQVIKRDGIACRYCGAVLLGDFGVPNMPTITLDHRQARVHGGGHQIENLLVSCGACNQRKSAHQARAWPPFPERFFDAHVVTVIEHITVHTERPKRWETAVLDVALGVITVLEFPAVLQTKPPAPKKITKQRPPKDRRDPLAIEFEQRQARHRAQLEAELAKRPETSLPVKIDPRDGRTVVDIEALRERTKAARRRQTIHDI